MIQQVQVGARAVAPKGHPVGATAGTLPSPPPHARPEESAKVQPRRAVALHAWPVLRASTHAHAWRLASYEPEAPWSRTRNRARQPPQYNQQQKPSPPPPPLRSKRHALPRVPRRARPRHGPSKTLRRASHFGWYDGAAQCARAPPPNCPRPRSSSRPQLWARRARCGPGAARSWGCRRPRPVARRRARPPHGRFIESSLIEQIHGRRTKPVVAFRRHGPKDARTPRVAEEGPPPVVFCGKQLRPVPHVQNAPLLPPSMDAARTSGRAAVDVRAAALGREGDEERGPALVATASRAAKGGTSMLCSKSGQYCKGQSKTAASFLL